MSTDDSETSGNFIELPRSRGEGEDPLDQTYFVGVAPKFGSTKCFILQLRDMASPYHGLPFRIVHCHAGFKSYPEACVLHGKIQASKVEIFDTSDLPFEMRGLKNLFVITFQHGVFEWRVTRTWKRKDIVNLLGVWGIPLVYSIRQKAHKHHHAVGRLEANQDDELPMGEPEQPGERRKSDFSAASDASNYEASESTVQNEINTMMKWLESHEVTRGDSMLNAATLKFLGISRLSFVAGLGPSLWEGEVTLQLTRNNCPRHRIRNRQRVWMVLKDSYVVFIKSVVGRMIDVMLTDRFFQFDQLIRPEHPKSADRICGCICSNSRNSTRDIITISNNELIASVSLCSTLSQPLRTGLQRLLDNADYGLGSHAGAVQSFAPPRDSTPCKWLVDGAAYFYDIAEALEQAQEEIFIADWFLSPEVLLRRPCAGYHELINILYRKATLNVKIFIMLYAEMRTLLNNHSQYTKQCLYDRLYKTKNIHIILHPKRATFNTQKNLVHEYLYSHHEKLAIIDQKIAFFGGIDLCWGRWDLPEHPILDRGVSVKDIDINIPTLNPSFDPYRSPNASTDLLHYLLSFFPEDEILEQVLLSAEMEQLLERVKAVPLRRLARMLDFMRKTQTQQPVAADTEDPHHHGAVDKAQRKIDLAGAYADLEARRSPPKSALKANDFLMLRGFLHGIKDGAGAAKVATVPVATTLTVVRAEALRVFNDLGEPGDNTAVALPPSEPRLPPSEPRLPPAPEKLNAPSFLDTSESDDQRYTVTAGKGTAGPISKTQSSYASVKYGVHDIQTTLSTCRLIAPPSLMDSLSRQRLAPGSLTGSIGRPPDAASDNGELGSKHFGSSAQCGDSRIHRNDDQSSCRVQSGWVPEVARSRCAPKPLRGATSCQDRNRLVAIATNNCNNNASRNRSSRAASYHGWRNSSKAQDQHSSLGPMKDRMTVKNLQPGQGLHATQPSAHHYSQPSTVKSLGNSGAWSLQRQARLSKTSSDGVRRKQPKRHSSGRVLRTNPWAWYGQLNTGFALKTDEAQKFQLFRGMDYINWMGTVPMDMNKPYVDATARECPRTGWHDVGCVVSGQAAQDVARHFIGRWNYSRKHGGESQLPALVPKSVNKSPPLGFQLQPPQPPRLSQPRNSENELTENDWIENGNGNANNSGGGDSMRRVEGTRVKWSDADATRGGHNDFEDFNAHEGKSDGGDNSQTVSNDRSRLQLLGQSGVFQRFTSYEETAAGTAEKKDRKDAAGGGGAPSAGAAIMGKPRVKSRRWLAPPSNCRVQILRSLGFWSGGLTQKEFSIRSAYAHLIERARHYLYIENQFFISSCSQFNESGGGGGAGSSSSSSASRNQRPTPDDRVKNPLCWFLFRKILEMHQNKRSFRVYIVLPALPLFTNKEAASGGISGQVQLMLHHQYTSLFRGGSSLFDRLTELGINPNQYVSVCSLRNWGRHPSGTLTTEQVYVHSKIIIADDQLCIIGSANINDRSMMGDADSELAGLFEDTGDDLQATTWQAGPAMVGKFAGSLRRYLMREHMGIAAASEEAAQLSDPTSENFFNGVWIAHAKKNRRIYEEVFRTYPNDCATFSELHSFSKSRGLAKVNATAAMKRLKEVRGHLVEHPSNFLIDESLDANITETMVTAGIAKKVAPKLWNAIWI